MDLARRWLAWGKTADEENIDVLYPRPGEEERALLGEDT